ncbi:hypothetical protein WN944_019753 [Citrus x changshan-huyou]|uniref:Uncharacterized protein n=1 Tax=Citrus x changshan-huyou TaxID=2935761 RepID=A0AAP0LYT5_9ROSI
MANYWRGANIRDFTLMVEKQLEILRGYELRLLRCTLASPPSDLPIQSQPLNEESQCSLLPLHEHVNSLIDSGHYLQVLYSDAAKLVLDTLDFVDINDSADCADRVYSELLQLVEAFIVNDSENDVDKACRVILLMCLSIAALFWFTQCNVTGPLVDNSPKCRFPLEVSTLEGNELIEWENWAHYQLMSVGSDLLGKFSYLQYIVFAKMLLMKTKDLLIDATVLPVNGIRTISWWLTRLLLMHQRILDERSSSLYDLLKLHDIDPSEIVSTFHLEAGLKHFESAEVAAGLQLSVIGVLGFRTVRQVEPKAQMVLVANTSSSNTSDVCPSINQVIHTHDSTVGDASDVFVAPNLLGNSHESESGVQCIHAGWDMAPYIEAIDSQQSSCFILKYFCDLLCIRWESIGSRTKGRALEMMDKLVEGISNSSPGVTQSIPFCYVICVPTIPALRKEYAKLLVSCGLIGEAIKIFEDLELWDNLILQLEASGGCFPLILFPACILDDSDAPGAVKWLRNTQNDELNCGLLTCDTFSRCSLGDVTNNDACYEKALEVSNDKQLELRSLARSAYDRGEYETSKILWYVALMLYFSFCHTARDVERALDGFTRAVQLDPDNGEAWNNIACLYALFFVVRSKSSADMWGLYARWLKSKGDLTMCSEALLKQVRSYQGSDLWKDRDRFKFGSDLWKDRYRFKRFSYASLELCKVYMEISSSSGSRRELFAAEMHLKNTFSGSGRILATVSLCMHLCIHAENLGHSFSTLNPPNSSTA